VATMWIRVNAEGRVTDTVIGGRLDDGIQLDIPDGYDPERQQDWRLADGALVYDPET
jgi:hypothetical protein